MMRSVLSRYRGRSRGQALVEFTLTALVFLLLLVMIVEVARILAAYVTIQHAARQAARYAVTGKWEATYAADPKQHFSAGSGDPFARIPPCWPLFDDDAYTPTANVYDRYEPYRNPRTCSIVAVALQGLTGLALDPNAISDEPNFYEIVVSAAPEDLYPNTGTFERQDAGGAPETRNYSLYYDDPTQFDGNQTGGVSRGFAGGPNEKVIVQIRYRLPIITPLVSAIVPSVELNGMAIMTNEAFGSTSLNRDAALPPDLPAVEPLSDAIPPDLLITSIAPNASALPVAQIGVDYPLDIAITNAGEYNVTDPFELTLYTSATDVGVSPNSDPFDTTGMTLLKTISVTSALDGGASLTLSSEMVQFPAEGTWYIYGWIDSGSVIDEIGVGAVADPAREENNASRSDAISVGSAVELTIPSVVPDNFTPGNAASVNFTVRVANAAGYSDAGSGTAVAITLPSDLQYSGSNPASICSGTAPNYTCTVGAIPAGSYVEFQLYTTTIDPAAAGVAQVFFTAVRDPAQEEPNTGNNDASATIYIHGTDLVVEKTVNDEFPVIGGPTFEYTVTVRNDGPNDATGVTVTETPPPNVNFLTVTPTQGSYAGNIWTVGDLADGAWETMTIVAEVVSPGGSNLMNTVTADMDQPDSFTGNNTDQVAISTESAELEVNKILDLTEDYEGGSVHYEITIKNNGPDDATNVKLVDRLPSGISYDSNSITAGTVNYDTTTREITWTIATIPDGNTFLLDIYGTIETGTDGTTITNAVTSLDHDQFDANTANDTPDDGGFTVYNRADLEMTVDTQVNGSPGDTARQGQELTFTWTISNNGPMDATDVSVDLVDLMGSTLLGELTVTNVTSSDGTYDVGTQTWSLASLAASDFATVTATATVNPRTTDDTYTETGTVTASDPVDPDTTNNDATVSVTLTMGPQVFVTQNFEGADAGCFVYVDGLSGYGTGTYVTGTHPVTGYSGNGISVNIGQGTSSATNMAGGWSCDFAVTTAANTVVTFYYRIDANTAYENNENVDVVVMIDGTSVSYPVARVSDGGDTGWVPVTVPLGNLAAGNHTIILGGYNNQKTESAETAVVYFDSVSVSETITLLAATFDVDPDPGLMTATPAQAFEGLIGTSPHNTNGNSNASYAAAQGNPAGSLRIDVGEYAATDTNPTNMSAGYEYTFTLASAADIYLTFDYLFIMSGDYDPGEDSYVLASLDDTTLFGTDLDNSVFHFEGDNVGINTGWTSSGSLYLGNLSAGTHTIMIGGFNDAATTLNEDTIIYIDNVYLTAN